MALKLLCSRSLPPCRTAVALTTMIVVLVLQFGKVKAVPATQTTAAPVKGASKDLASQRNDFIRREESLKIGGKPTSSLPTLSASELKVDDYIMAMKSKMIEEARTEGAYFSPAVNFMTSRPHMESNDLFKVIQDMPKGGALHLHKSAIASLDWLVANVTYRPNLYWCTDTDYSAKLHFYGTPPADDFCKWQLVSEYRQGLCATELVAFDKSLRSNMSLVTADPDRAYPDINSVWDVFEGYFSIVGDIISYRPVFGDYVRQALKEFLADGVQYLEIRGSLPKLYELDQSEHPREWSVENVYRPVFREFKKKNPDFIGAKLIATTFRGRSPESIGSFINETVEVFQKHPDLVVGADLVGQEDTFHPLKDFQDQLLSPSRRTPPVHLPYYFHAGETVWLETETDWNMLDAVLLNSTRIGHGYALYKHPLLMEKVRAKNIAIEISPISNQVLKLVEDLRNHPATALIADNMPVVISSDDPVVWDALPLTHDFYVTFLALTGKDAGLATMKQLAINSINYSAMTSTEKTKALAKWKKKWDAFITKTANRI